jgi:putative salt-induced outer membrane protein YdiY
MARAHVALAALFILVARSPLAGQDKKEKTQAINVDFGFVNASGNTSVTTLNLGDKYVTNTADKRVIFTQSFNAVRSQTDGEKQAENYRAQVRLDYGLGGKLYLFGLTGWDRNVFAGVSRRFEETVGLSYKALALPNDDLAFEIGLSQFQQRNTIATAGSFDDNFTAGRLAGLYKRKLSGSSTFTQGLELIPNFSTSKDFRLNSETALAAPISTNVGLKLGYSIRYDNLPGFKPAPAAVGSRFKKTDRFLTAGISIAY